MNASGGCASCKSVGVPKYIWLHFARGRSRCQGRRQADVHKLFCVRPFSSADHAPIYWSARPLQRFNTAADKSNDNDDNHIQRGHRGPLTSISNYHSHGSKLRGSTAGSHRRARIDRVIQVPGLSFPRLYNACTIHRLSTYLASLMRPRRSRAACVRLVALCRLSGIHLAIEVVGKVLNG